MNKVKITIIKDNSVATLHPKTEIIQEVTVKARDCSEFVVNNSESSCFMFGSAVIYTQGVQAFIFEDVE